MQMDEEFAAKTDDVEKTPEEGQLRLVAGKTEYEGNVQIFHAGRWGSICDDEWDEYEARIVCAELGYPGTIGATHSSRFGYMLSTIWMDNIYCYGTEERLTDCRFEGWGVHDCEGTEAAGARCKPPAPTTAAPPPTTTPKPKTPIGSSHTDVEVRVGGGRVPEEGRLEVRLGNSASWGTVCGDGWGIREAAVACRELGLGFAQSAPVTHLFTNGAIQQQNGVDSKLESADDGDGWTLAAEQFATDVALTGVSCRGDEEALVDCEHDADNFCPGAGNVEVASVMCVDEQADLEPDIYALVSSCHLQDLPLVLMQCAMEENCAAAEAYRLRAQSPYWQQEMRRLLRFTTSVLNKGNADFRPFIPKDQWIWHGCHYHYHSMEVFAHFDVLDDRGVRVAEGHKASFCLEDNECDGRHEPKFDCENYGDQGITIGCKDIYYSNIDCQWIDITEVPVGTYTFRMAINPEYKVAEQTFENNVAVCSLYYTQQYASLSNCTLTRP